MNKRALLIIPSFFNYDMIIKNALEANNLSVDMLHDRPITNWFLRFLITRAKFLAVDRLFDSYYLMRAQETYDYIIIINGQTVSFATLLALKSRNPNARFVLYLWDSLHNRPLSAKKQELFDVIFSFDYQDCQKYGFRYKELFIAHSTNIASTATEKKYGYSMIGTLRSERIDAVFDLLKLGISANPIFLYFYVQSTFVNWFFMTTSFKYRSKISRYASTTPLSHAKCLEIMSKSKCVIDVHHPNQSGLTIRSIEALLSGAKLLTTNKNIKNSILFNEANVKIVEELTPEDLNDWNLKAYTSYPDEIKERFIPRNWVGIFLKNE